MYPREKQIEISKVIVGWDDLTEEHKKVYNEMAKPVIKVVSLKQEEKEVKD